MVSVSSLTMDLDSPEPIVVSFTYDGTQYYLSEASEDANAKYRSAIIKGSGTDARGETVPNQGIVEVKSLLVSLCLNKVDSKGVQVHVPLADVRKMPSRIVEQLYKKVREISGFDDDPDETPQALAVRIMKLQAKLDEMVKKDDTSKNSLSSMGGTSD